MFEYAKLWKLLKTKGYKKNDLKKYVGITPATLAKLNKNQNVSMEVLSRLCDFLECDISDIVEHVYTPYKIDDTLGTFKPNKKEDIHNWFSYLEGYSDTLVETELKKLNNVESILDPFAGSGTTPLVGVQKNLMSYYCETNPVMAFITKTKTQTAFEIAENKNLKIKLKNNIINALDYLKSIKLKNDNKKIDFGGFEKYFEENNLRLIIEYKKYINKNIKDDKIKDIFIVALAGVAVDVSKMIRRGDLRYAKGKELNKTNQDFIKEIEKKLKRIYSDISNIEDKKYGKSLFLSKDCRDIKESNIVDAVITSPPYLNGTNYIRNTKLELKLLNFVNTEKEISKLHKKGVVAGINNVSNNQKEMKMIESIKDIIITLDKVSYDARIQKMIVSYFNDMSDVFKSISKVLKDGGYLIMDIGDSQFAGVHVPTHDILIEIAETQGFELYDSEIIRTRKSRNGFKLTQRILRFKIKKQEKRNE